MLTSGNDAVLRCVPYLFFCIYSGLLEVLMRFDHREDLVCSRQRAAPYLLALLIAGGVAISPALAQKYPGATLDDVPAQRPYTPPPSLPRQAPAMPYVPRQAAPPLPNRPLAAAPRESEPEARALADRLPLDPATANLESRNPQDLPGTMRQLGLRVPNGPRTDMRSHTPSTRELVDALRH